MSLRELLAPPARVRAGTVLRARKGWVAGVHTRQEPVRAAERMTTADDIVIGPTCVTSKVAPSQRSPDRGIGAAIAASRWCLAGTMLRVDGDLELAVGAGPSSGSTAA